MTRPVKTVIVIGGVLAALFVIAAALVPVLFSGERLKPKAEAELSRLAGRRVSLGTTTVSIWSGLALRAESLEIGEPLAGASAGAPQIHAGPTSVHVAFLPLLHKEVQARSITIERARVTQGGSTILSDVEVSSRLRLAPDGALSAEGRVSAALDLLKGRPRAEATFDGTFAHGTLDLRSLASTLGPIHLEGAGQVAAISSAAPRVHLDMTAKLARSSVKGKLEMVVDPAAPTATFDLAAPLLDLEEAMGLAGSLGVAALRPESGGLGLVPVATAAEPPPAAGGDLLGRAKATGILKAERCVYRGLEMTGVEARVNLDHGLLKLEDTKVSMFGGGARGSATARPFETSRPFSLQQKVERVAIGSLIAALAPAQKGTVEGTAALELGVTGRAGEAAILPSIDGSGSLLVNNGKIASVGVIKQVMGLLETAGAKGIAKDETPFDRLSAHFALSAGVAKTSDLQFRSPDLDADGHGSIGLGGALDLDVVGSFSKAVSDQLVAKTAALKFRQGADGRVTVPLQVRGTLMAPRVQLDVNAVLHEGLKKEVEKDVKKKLLDRLFKH